MNPSEAKKRDQEDSVRTNTSSPKRKKVAVTKKN